MSNRRAVVWYLPHEVRYQEERREAWMHFARPDWLGTAEGADFSYRFFGIPVPFSGDTRPTDRSVGGRDAH